MKRRPLALHPTNGRKPAVDVVIDSGAYSAWNSGNPIDLDEYCEFLEANANWIGDYVALDVINPESPEDAAAASFKNYQIMRKRGLKPIPVFHAKEDVKWLHKYLDAGADYIGLAATSLRNKNFAADRWYELMWCHLVNHNGDPVVKVHAFGEGRLSTLQRFPWYSADSASWLYAAQRAGSILIGDGRMLSFRNDAKSSKSCTDVMQLQKEDRKVFNQLLAKAGMSWEVFARRDQPKHTYVARTYLMALYFRDMEAKVNQILPMKFRPVGLIPQTTTMHNAPGIIVNRFRLHLVVGGNIAALAALGWAKIDHCLSSYAHIAKMAHYKNLDDWAFDPMGFSGQATQYREYIQALQEITNDEEPRPEQAVASVQSADQQERIEPELPKLGPRSQRRAWPKHVRRDAEQRRPRAER